MVAWVICALARVWSALARRAVLRECQWQSQTLLAERIRSLERDLELVGKQSADSGRAAAAALAEQVGRDRHRLARFFRAPYFAISVPLISHHPCLISHYPYPYFAVSAPL